MASSDDEEETFADTVSDYYFCDGDDEPLSFSKLPLQWNESESESENPSPTTGPIFLRGTADNGLQKLYKAVKAWKYELSKYKPEISVLSKDNHWMKLLKPRKSFENEIRTILITVHCLSYLKSKPEASAKSLWDHLSKVFSLYDVRPSENDLRDHMNFIRDAVDRDETLAKSMFLTAFLENPRKRKVSEDAEAATKPSFIVDDTNDEPQDDDFATEPNEDIESDEDDPSDSVCAVCDNGGSLTCCDGKCFRSFHATPEIEEAEESNCQSLGLTPEQVKSPIFRCDNCLHSQHQCFVCDKLGSSDKSSGAEVFRCSSASCGHFYHPKCVAKLLQPKAEDELKNLLEKIGAGEPFICPAHKCAVCKQTENEKVKDLQFAICRRCPISYHRKCLPREIMFESQTGDDDIVRAWDDLLSKSRALIYCLNHDIDEELGTPVRTIIFRDIFRTKMDQQSKLPLKKKKALVKEKGADSDYSTKKSVMKSQKVGEKPSTKMEDSSSKKRAPVPISSGSVPLKKKKVTDTSKNSLRRSLSAKVKMPSSNDGQPSLGSKLFDIYMNKGTESNNSDKDDICVDENKQTKSVPKEIVPPIDEDSKQRILDLMKDASSSITLEEVKKYHKGKVPSTHTHSTRADKTINLSRVEGAVEALNVALKKLEEGCSLEDAMAVCEPGVLDQLMRWKDKLRVYLAPFLHGMRYTSFGRHFTKVEKLGKIVDKLKLYVEDGDTVVDFCCGANDFSSLMKKHLDEMGKTKCSYKNYDITRPKNDFYFEKRDWMTVRPKELPKSSKLIMGLNPPFGFNAALANRFIQQALKFMPKLIILIVPPETERLDSEKQKCPYDLVWEDEELLAGRSFYLPGSIDVNAKQQESWNNTTPLLYLWSRPDWTTKHKTIAQQHGHIMPAEQDPPARADQNLPGPSLQTENNDMQVDDDLLMINEEPERTNSKYKTKSDTKKNKKESPKKKQTPPREKLSNQSSKRRNLNSQEFKTEKQEDDKHPSRQDDKRSPVPSREDEPPKPDIKYPSSGPIAQDETRGTVNSDISHVNDVSQPFDRHLERKYNRHPPSTSEVMDQSINQHLERREPYVYRRPDAPNHATLSYPLRPDPPPVQHHNPGGYDSRVGRGGSYLDEMEMGSRGGGGYHEPTGPTRYGGHPDMAPYNNNRSSTSTMQRYAPRLDELNHTRMGGRPDPMEEINHSRMGGIFGRAEPPPMANRGLGGYGPPVHGPGFGAEPMGFAPGPYNPYLHQNSSGGWLNE